MYNFQNNTANTNRVGRRMPLCYCGDMMQEVEKERKRIENPANMYKFVPGRTAHEATLPWFIGNIDYSPRQHLLKNCSDCSTMDTQSLCVQHGNASLRWPVHSPPLPPNNAHNTFLYLYYLV